MIKESILFVIGTAALIYFVTPSEKATDSEPDTQEIQKAVPTVSQASDDGWGEEDETDDGEESFIFGEPLIDPDDFEDVSAKDEYGSDSPKRAKPSQKRSAPASKSEQKKLSGSPKPHETGGLNNPIVMQSNMSSSTSPGPAPSRDGTPR